MHRILSPKSVSEESEEKLDEQKLPDSWCDEDLYNNGDGIVFPNKTSPFEKRRSVREVEQQMDSLQKENFNLKLRIYFLEERVPGYQRKSNEGPDSSVKGLIDTMIENELLRKELVEKQNLLIEAAQAMHQMEQIQEEMELKSQMTINELKEKLQTLEMESEDSFSCELKDWSEASIRESDGKIENLELQNINLGKLLAEREEVNKECENQIKKLTVRSLELIELLETKEEAFEKAEETIKILQTQYAKVMEDNRHLKETLENFRKGDSNINLCKSQVLDQQDVLNKMQATISMKSTNTAQLLNQFQDYQKLISRMNIENNYPNHENQFLKNIIVKLQRIQDESLSLEKK